MSDNLDYANSIRHMAEKHNRLFHDSIPLIASENIMSPLAMEMLLSDFGARYAEGLPYHRYYQGNSIVDELETLVIDLAKKFFRADNADPRPISGTVANIATIYGLTKPGDPITVPPLSGGGHISAAKFGAVGLRGLDSSSYPFDVDRMNIDVDGAIKLIKEKKPKVCLFGQSVFLFPTPLKDLNDAFNEVGCRVWYDAAHVLGLIGGGQFQDPLREGASLITGSTHKTFPGPQHGIILGVEDSEMWKSVQRGLFPGSISNHHLNAMAALGITLAEELEYGEAYAKQTIRNAQILGEELASEGIKMLGENNGYTSSHTLVADVRDLGGGKKCAEDLETSNIILNKNLLPWDTSKNSQDPSGLRIGSQEVTRIGFGPSEMKQVAKLLADVIVRHRSPEAVKLDIMELKNSFNRVKYCFGEHEAYKYVKILGDL